MTYNTQRALELLRIGSGRADATFREGQEDAIRHVVEGRGRLLVVQKTGWGKSFVYFIATKLLREAGNGPALLISPLLALMRNQIAAAERMGVRAATINSDNQDEWAEVEAKLRRNEVDILLIAPEKLGNEWFNTQVLAGIAGRISLMVIDEAHCISDWGHDFRPHYRLLERIARTLPANLRLLATTATANNRVMEDLVAVLGPNMKVLRGDLNRGSLTLQTMRLPSQAVRMAWIAQRLRKDEDKKKDPLGPVATRSNLIQIYEKLINQDAKHHLQAIRSAGQLYALMLARNTDEAWAPLDKPLKDLDRIQGAPSYLLMLYLLVRREALGIDVAQLEEIARLLVCFFVRRNLTDTPPTRDLTRLFMAAIDKVAELSGAAVVTTIPYQAQPGKALCVWGDAGWGGLVRQGKYHDGKFADDLVEACVKMVREWNPQPKPTWVTCVPSLRHPDLVPNFAKRLAAALGLPFHMVIAKTDDRPEQKTMANSTQQARNIDGSLTLNGQPVPHGPVILVDDMVDSRWTLTVAAWLLRKSGSGDVWPMALSQTGHDE